VILPDVNLLVYAYNADAPHHAAARAWWEKTLVSGEEVGIPWAVSMGFVRLMTHPRVLVRPLEPERAIQYVQSWFELPAVRALEPGARHLEILIHLLRPLGVAASLTTDAHLAALAIEYRAELCSNDADLARFSGLVWRNPLG